MENSAWVMWVVVAVIFAVYEMFTFNFFTIWFAAGAGVAAVFAYLRFDPPYQWTAFAVVTILLVAATRRIAHRITKKMPSHGVGAERFLGQTGTVTQEIDTNQHKGKVRLGRDESEWNAAGESGEQIASGAQVTVVKVEGTRLIVKEVK